MASPSTHSARADGARSNDEPSAGEGKRSTLAGWGRVAVEAREVTPENLVTSPIAPIARGLGRSYGDSSLPPADRPVALNTTRADRLLSFDEATGLLLAESGLSLAEMNRLFLPRGWFTPVSPGTAFVTLGGMVASDIHGKNHHVDGCIGAHVIRLRMQVADGRVLWCSRQEHEDLFRATVGGMGLTGHILEVELKMRRIPSPWIYQETKRIANIDVFQDALVEAAKEWPMTVGWIDCVKRGKDMGRGILIQGRWAEAGEAPKQPPKALARPTLPFEFPNWAIGRPSVALFNEMYYRAHFPPKRSALVDPLQFFYPLDAIQHWNRVYGPRGFTQYQCVLPREAGPGSARRVLEILTEHGCASPLAVIKDCGAEGEGVLSFPKPGMSIALDIPLGDGIQEAINDLNEQVLKEGGRMYLTKDTLTLSEHFHAMEPRLEEFNRIRDQWDPERVFRSRQSVRLLKDPER
ncbi:MAG: FAD-binding oxidoreductase [Myxococcota bacterium]